MFVRYRPRLLLALGGVGVGVALAGLVALVRAHGLDTVDKAASVAGMLVGVASLAVALWVARGGGGIADEPELLERAAQRLADLVRRQWDDEVGMRGLRRPRPIRVRWSTTGRPAASAEAVLSGRAGVSGRPLRLRLVGGVMDLAGVVRRLPQRQLVVLGEAGAGKTVLAILFVLDELAHRRSVDPVPVLLSVAGWDPRRTHVDEWLALRVEAEYPGLRDARRYGVDAAARLVRAGRILPVLDGLDEMPAALAPAAIAALDGAVGPAGLVLTCRSRDYETIVAGAGTVLSRAAVVEILPVAVADEIGYLAGAEPGPSRRWEPVRAAVREQPDGVLAQTLSTPLMLSLARVVCAPGGLDPGELVRRACAGSAADLRRELIRRYVPTVYDHERTYSPGARTAHYRLERVERWLAFLAHHLRSHRGGSPDLAWWHLAAAVPVWLIGLLVGTVSAVIPAILLFVFGQGWNVAEWQSWAVIAAIVWCAAVGVVVGMTAGRHTRALTDPFSERGFGGAAGQALRDTLVAGLLAMPLLLYRPEDLVPVAVMIVAAAGVLASVSAGLRTDGSTSPRRLVVQLRGNARRLIGRLLIGFLVGVVAGVPIVLSDLSLFGFGEGSATGGVRALLVAGFAGSAFIGLPLALALALRATVDEDTAITPRSVLRADRTTFVAIGGGAFLLLEAQLVGIVIAVDGGPGIEVIGYVAVAAVPAALATATAAAPAWPCFLAARSWLAACGRLPWRLMRFLTDGRNRGVVRQTGSVYQFRHALLQEHYTGARCGDRWSPRHPPGRPVLARERALARWTATILPIALLVTATWLAVGRAVDTLYHDAAYSLEVRARELREDDPLMSLRLRYTALHVRENLITDGSLYASSAEDRVRLAREAFYLDGTARASILPSAVRSMSVNRMGNLLVIADQSAGLQMRRIQTDGRLDEPTYLVTPAPIAPYKWPNVRAMRFAPDGTYLAALHHDPPRVTVWRMSAGSKSTEVTTFPLPGPALNLSIHGDTVTTLEPNGTVRRYAWRRPGTPVTASFTLPAAWSEQIAFGVLSDDGTAVAYREAADDPFSPSRLIVWLPDSGARPSTIIDEVYAMDAAFGPDRREFVFVGDRNAGIQDLASGARIELPAGNGTDRVAITSARVVLAEGPTLIVIDRHRLGQALPSGTKSIDKYLCVVLGSGLDQRTWRDTVPHSWLPTLTDPPQICP